MAKKNISKWNDSITNPQVKVPQHLTFGSPDLFVGQVQFATPFELVQIAPVPQGLGFARHISYLNLIKKKYIYILNNLIYCQF